MKSGNISALYPGFRFVNKLDSIQRQRMLQVEIISQIINRKSFLSIGVGYGDELDFIAREGALKDFNEIYAIDIAESISAHFLSQPNLQKYIDKIAYEERDLLAINEIHGDNYWDCIQCGFVLEDINYEMKRQAYNVIYNSLSEGGIFILSEMFPNIQSGDLTSNNRAKQISELYNNFIEELKNLYEESKLNKQQYELLYGNTTSSGLLKTKIDAKKGLRDYFESKNDTMQKLKEAGFDNIHFESNPINKLLGVYYAQKLA